MGHLALVTGKNYRLDVMVTSVRVTDRSARITDVSPREDLVTIISDPEETLLETQTRLLAAIEELCDFHGTQFRHYRAAKAEEVIKKRREGEMPWSPRLVAPAAGSQEV